MHSLKNLFLRWNSIPPKIDGWYWFKAEWHDGILVEAVVQVRTLHPDGRICFIYKQDIYMLDDVKDRKVYWAGPLNTPDPELP